MPGKSSLKQMITRLIETGGPISLADYMHLCLADPRHGYYKTRQAIGGSSGGGDFITAPEISQMFGELIGIWCVTAWQALDRPARFTLAEAGPGRGSLMKDLLRAAGQVPEFLEAADLRLIESSQRLVEQQGQMLAEEAAKVRSLEHVDAIEELPDQPLVLVANEFLDAIPFRQYVKTENGWQEVGISLGEGGSFVRGATAAQLDHALLPPGADLEPEGAVFEHAPAREALVQTIAERIAAKGGAALFIDYGHQISGFGDTFQAVRLHQYADPLEAPGKADLTSHVDFDRLIRVARSVQGINAGLTTQGDFLLNLGLLERAGALGANKPSAHQNAIRSQVERLAAPNQMGSLFKAMAVFPDMLRLPGFEI